MDESPETVGLDSQRWQRLLERIETWCDRDEIPAAALLVGRSDRATPAHVFGRQRLDAATPVRDDAIFLVASITKPVVAMAALLLVERGEITLSDRVADWIPEFGKHGKNGIRIRHLLTHTSGLPDMLPDNRELRAAHAPLSAFVEGTCGVEPDFPAGRGVQYQSMGFAVLGELIHRVSGRTCAEFLRAEFFEPLGMRDTVLGAPDAWFTGDEPAVDRIAEIRPPQEQADASDWGWNSRYWRGLGAPWGGLLTTPADLAKFAQMMLAGGRFGDIAVLSPAAVEAATRNQLLGMRDVPQTDKECRPWGYGWRLNRPAQSAAFGDLADPRSYGHSGATGTILWLDPDRDFFCIFLTTQPQPHGEYLARVCSAVAGALR